jgi:UDP-glucose 4-epimerase
MGTGRPNSFRARLPTRALSTSDGCLASVDARFHLASTVGVKLVVSQPLESLLADVRGVRTVVEAAARHGVRKVFTSTRRSRQALRWLCPRRRRSPARAPVHRALELRHGKGLRRGNGARLPPRAERRDGHRADLQHTVGPRQAGAYGMVLPRFVSQALAGEALTVYGDGQQSRCFSHISDKVGALIKVMDSDSAIGGTFNVGCDRDPDHRSRAAGGCA